MDAILHRIKAPTFPARDFVITDYGAKTGEKEDCTAAIARAITACHDAGGGRVVVPVGMFLTGAIHLKSNVNLHLKEGATLRFLTDPANYTPVVRTRWEGTECMNYSPLIYAFEQDNIAITGKGTLDGAAAEANWWAWARRPAVDRASRAGPDIKKLVEMGQANVPVEQRIFGPGHYLRPNFIQPYRCKNVLIEGVTLLRSPMWEVNPVLCTNVIVRNLVIDSDGPNNDGCNPDSSRDVLIENCSFTTGDDCIAIKSGRNNDGRRVAVACENLVIQNCLMKNGHAGVAIGSEVSGDCRNVFIQNCKMDGPQFDRVLRFKSNAVRGGTIENIHMRAIEIGRVNEAILTIDMNYEEGPRGNFQPVMRNVSIDHCTSKSSPRVVWITGIENGIVDGIRFSHSTFSGVETAEVISGVRNISFEHVNIVPVPKNQSGKMGTASTGSAPSK